MNSKIAVIMPVYNAGKFLKGSIESVLAQKFKDISLICIDDVSIDDSSKIIEEYSKNDSRVIYLKNDENSGPSATRNRGLDYVYENMPNVEYITFVDADDKIDEIKNYLELTTSTTKTLRDSNKIDSILNKFENDLKQHKNEVELLEKKVYSRDTEIARLKNQLVSKNEEIDELEDKVDKLQEIVDTFQQIWRKFLMYLQNKFFSNDKKTHEIIDELYYKDILDDKDIKIIHNDYYERHNNRDDDIEL